MSAGDGACVRLLCFRDPPCRVGQITIVGLRKTDRQRSEAIRDWSRFTGDYFLIPKIRISHILSAQGTGPQDAPYRVSSDGKRGTEVSERPDECPAGLSQADAGKSQSISNCFGMHSV